MKHLIGLIATSMLFWILDSTSEVAIRTLVFSSACAAS